MPHCRPRFVSANCPILSSTLPSSAGDFMCFIRPTNKNRWLGLIARRRWFCWRSLMDFLSAGSAGDEYLSCLWQWFVFFLLIWGLCKNREYGVGRGLGKGNKKSVVMNSRDFIPEQRCLVILLYIIMKGNVWMDVLWNKGWLKVNKTQEFTF